MPWKMPELFGICVMNKKVFIAQYNPCVYESAFGTISIHETEAGATQAMETHKKEHIELYEQDPPDWEVWQVIEVEILP